MTWLEPWIEEPVLLAATIGAHPNPKEVPLRDWFQIDGSSDTPEPTTSYAQTAHQCGAPIGISVDREIRREKRRADAIR